MRVFLYLLVDRTNREASARRLQVLLEYARSRPLTQEPDTRLDWLALDRTPIGNRPGGKKLLRELRRGDALVLDGIEALGASRTNWLRCMKDFWRRGVALHLLAGDAEPIVVREPLADADRERLARHIDVSVAAAMSRRIRQTMGLLKQNRRHYSGRPPFGWQVAQLPDGRKRIVASRCDRYWTPRLLAWREAGRTRADMLQELRRRGAATPEGKPWTARRVDRVLFRALSDPPQWLVNLTPHSSLQLHTLQGLSALSLKDRQR
jgi:DNA invertase Pin-like site-specific DNA recombinase